MKNQKGVSMITLIITIIVIIILAAIAFIASGDTAGEAQFTNFTQRISDLQMNFQIDPLSKIQTEYEPLGRNFTSQQEIWLASAAAREAAYDADNSILTGIIVPAGVTFEKFTNTTNPGLYNADGTVNKDVLAADVACYELEISQVDGYEYGDLYGDNLGLESYYVTENGLVFTLPGYPRTVDGEDRFYITQNLYYKATGEGERWGEAVYAVDAVVDEDPGTVTGQISRSAGDAVTNAELDCDAAIRANIVARKASGATN